MQLITNIIMVGVCIFLSACSQNYINQPKKNLPRTSLMTNSGSLEPSKRITLDGVDFDIVQKDGKTTFWSTNDIRFTTPEGYSVGNTLKDVSPLDKKRMSQDRGYAYLISLDSGWQLGFCEGSTCTDTPPTADSVIQWIQKREKPEDTGVNQHGIRNLPIKHVN